MLNIIEYASAQLNEQKKVQLPINLNLLSIYLLLIKLNCMHVIIIMSVCDTQGKDCMQIN